MSRAHRCATCSAGMGTRTQPYQRHHTVTVLDQNLWQCASVIRESASRMRGALVLGARAPKHVAAACSPALFVVRRRTAQLATAKWHAAPRSPPSRLRATWRSVIHVRVRRVRATALALAAPVFVHATRATKACVVPRRLRVMVCSIRTENAARECCWTVVLAAQVPPQR